MAKRKPEQELQIACADYLRKCYIDGLFWTAINPSSYKSKMVAIFSKKMGLIAGVPDMLFIWKGKPFFIEFKAERGKLTDNQRIVFDILAEQYVKCYEVKTLEQFIEIIKKETN